MMTSNVSTRVRRGVKALAGVTAVVTVVACSPPSVSVAQSESSAPGAGGRTAITWFQWWANEQGWEVLDAVEAQFEAANPDVDLQITDISSSQAHDKLVSLALAGQLPDVFTMTAPWIVEFSEAGMAAPVTQYLEQEDPEYRADLETPMLQTWKDQYWGVPITNGPAAMFYNKAVLQQAGVAVPTTWAEFEAAIPAIRTTGKYAITGNLGSEPPYPITYEVFPFIVQAGGEILDDEGMPAFNGPEGVAALEYLRRTQQEGATPGAFAANETQKRENFVAGNTAFMFESPAGINVIRTGNPDLDYGVAPMPAGARSGTMLQGSLLGMSAAGANKDAAWKFMRWIGSAEGSEFWSAQTNFFPANLTAIGGARIAADERLSVFADVLTESDKIEFLDAQLPDAIALRRDFTLQVQKFMDGQITAQDALDTAAEQWRTVITKSAG